MMVDEVVESDDEVVESDDEVVERLAKLSEIEYEQRRQAEARRLGVPRAALDRQVKNARAMLTMEDWEREWHAAQEQYIDKYLEGDEVGTTEELRDVLNLAILKFPNKDLSSEDWSDFMRHYLTTIQNFLTVRLELESKYWVPLVELTALLDDLHDGRRNKHIPRRRGGAKDPIEKSVLMGYTAALVTMYHEHYDETVDQACKRAARLLLDRAHVVFDSGNLDQELWKFIRNYRKDILRKKRDKVAVNIYEQFAEPLGRKPGADRAGRLKGVLEEVIIDYYTRRDLRVE